MEAGSYLPQYAPCQDPLGYKVSHKRLLNETEAGQITEIKKEVGEWLHQFSSVAQLCLTICNSMDCTPGFSVHHQLVELTQTHVY